MNPIEHTSMIQLLSVQITGDTEVITPSKVTPDTQTPTKTATTEGIEGISLDSASPANPSIIRTKTDAFVGKPEADQSKENKADIIEGERIYHEALAYIKDAISPAMMKITPQDIQINDTFCKTLFTYAYPDFLDGNWLSPLINWDAKFDVSLFIYPTDSQKIQKYLRRRLTELQSEKYLNQERGLTSDPYIDAQLQDVEELRDLLVRGSEKYFHFSIYITLYADDRDKLLKISNDIQNMLHGRNILTKPALLRAEQGYTATGPFCRDEVSVYRNISTRGLSTAFPFTSATLSQDDGVLYGINTHNNSLIIYDRFRTENANMVVLAKS